MQDRNISPLKEISGNSFRKKKWSWNADLVTFTEETHNIKLHFFCSSSTELYPVYIQKSGAYLVLSKTSMMELCCKN